MSLISMEAMYYAGLHGLRPVDLLVANHIDLFDITAKVQSALNAKLPLIDRYGKLLF